MKTRPNVCSTVVLFIFIMTLAVSNLCVASGPVVVNVPSKTQLESNWCWAATSQSILEFYSHRHMQCTIVNWARAQNEWGSADCCDNPSSSKCNKTNTLHGDDGSVDEILLHYGVDSDYDGSPLSYDEVVTQINTGRPFLMRWGWTSGGGHALIGYGYYGSNMYYMNPSAGKGYTISKYSWVVSSSDHEWTSTLLMNTIPFLSDLTPFAPSGWSDKIVVSKSKGTHKDSANLNSLDNLYVDWSMANLGMFPVPWEFYSTLSVDGTVKKSWTTTSLAPGSHTGVNDYSLGKLPAGTHWITLMIDTPSRICELEESNNTYTKKITVIQSPNDKPNLTLYQPAGWSGKIVVSRTTGTHTDSTNLTYSDPLYVDFSAINNGTQPVSKTFWIYLYVDGVLKQQWYDSNLGVNAQAGISDYSMGKLPVGTHTIKILLDAKGAIDEINESDNTFTKTLTVSSGRAGR